MIESSILILILFRNLFLTKVTCGNTLSTTALLTGVTRHDTDRDWALLLLLLCMCLGVWQLVCLIIFLVEAEVVVAKEWGNRVVGCRREVVKVEELKKPEKKQEYQDKLKEAYDRVKEREAGELEEEWRLMKESLVGYASDVCGKRFVGGCMRRGSEWWNEGVKMKVEEKKECF